MPSASPDAVSFAGSPQAPPCSLSAYISASPSVEGSPSESLEKASTAFSPSNATSKPFTIPTPLRTIVAPPQLPFA